MASSTTYGAGVKPPKLPKQPNAQGLPPNVNRQGAPPPSFGRPPKYPTQNQGWPGNYTNAQAIGSKPTPPKPPRVEPRHEPMPYDSQYFGDIRTIDKGEGDSLAKISGQRVSGAGTYGFGDGQSFDPNANYDLSNPFTRAGLLQYSYHTAQRGANTKMNIYSGAYGEQQSLNVRNYGQGINDLDTQAHGYFQGLNESERSVRNTAETAKGDALQRLVARNLANRPTSPGLKGGTYKSAFGVSYRTLKGGWFQLPNNKVVNQQGLVKFLSTQPKFKGATNWKQFSKAAGSGLSGLDKQKAFARYVARVPETKTQTGGRGLSKSARQKARRR